MDLPGMKLAPEGAPKETLEAIPGLPPDLRAFLEQHDGRRSRRRFRSRRPGFSSSGPTEGPRHMATSRGCGIIGTAASR